MAECVRVARKVDSGTQQSRRQAQVHIQTGESTGSHGRRDHGPDSRRKTDLPVRRQNVSSRDRLQDLADVSGSEDDSCDHDDVENVRRKAHDATDSSWCSETNEGRDARFEGDPRFNGKDRLKNYGASLDHGLAFAASVILRDFIRTLSAAHVMTSDNPAASCVTNQGSLEEIVQSLSRACAFPVSVDDVTVRQTHISVVFLGGELVYKMKKPVKLPFLDFSTVDLRQHFCAEEVRINRPWAPDVYLGVVPITRDAGGMRFEGNGPVIDWAVKMRRLPESATLRSRLQDGLLEWCDLERVARRIAATHQQASRVVADQASEANAEFRRQWTENWVFAQTLNADVIEPQVQERLQTLSGERMQRHEAALVQRAKDGWIRDVHGDLRLEHVFLFPERAIPNDIVVLDGIEFSPGLRRIDVAADMAFLVMELSFVGRCDLAESFADIYFSETNDVTGGDVLPLFAIYRSAVRAKVAAILSAESEISQPDRDKALARSRAHWLWCLSELEDPDRRPALVLVSGLPGTGKSTLSRMLADTAHFEVLRSDVIRKELFTSAAATGDSAAMYSADNTQRVYDECRTRARRRLLAGGRVIVDATFQREANRQAFLQLAIDCGVRAIWLECTAPADVTQERLAARHGDASDADWSVYHQVRKQWEPASDFNERFHATIASEAGADSALQISSRILQAQGLIKGVVADDCQDAKIVPAGW